MKTGSADRKEDKPNLSATKREFIVADFDPNASFDGNHGGEERECRSQIYVAPAFSWPEELELI
jgi:hypothetical protein